MKKNDRYYRTNSQESNNEVPTFTVGMLGAANVGKTTLSYQFTTSEYICAYDTSLGEYERMVCTDKASTKWKNILQMTNSAKKPLVYH